MPVMKTLLEKLSPTFHYNTSLPDLPSLTSGPSFFEEFRSFCHTDQWTSFIAAKVSEKE